MKLRSVIERRRWSLGTDYLEPYFIKGVRKFFGVRLDNNGNLLFDDQEPIAGLFENWERAYKYGKEKNNLKG